MSATLKIVPAVLDRFRRTLVGLKTPRALEVLDQTVRQLERGEASALRWIPSSPRIEGSSYRLRQHADHAGTCSLQSPHQHANLGTAAASSRSAA
jgi:hypothetical protein